MTRFWMLPSGVIVVTVTLAVAFPLFLIVRAAGLPGAWVTVMLSPLINVLRVCPIELFWATVNVADDLLSEISVGAANIGAPKGHSIPER